MSHSTLFSSLTIANGEITLKHRVVMAPMTRNRGIPLSEDPSSRIWVPDDMVAKYYSQRASPGGLLITEGIPPSLEASGMPGVPGLFHESQFEGWRKVVEGVHAKGGFIYAQLWHAGRATIPQMTGCPVVSASATAWETEESFPFRTVDTKEKIKYKDFPPLAMTKDHIANTTQDFVNAAKAAINIGFDGIEINGGNGNLLDQFLHSNINSREDSYGGSPQTRCKFPLDLVAAIAAAVGSSNVAMRLEPAGLYNGTNGTERVETWSFLCEQLASTYQGDNKLSYIHFIEPRFDRITEQGDVFHNSWNLPTVSNERFRDIIKRADIPCISCGAWDATNMTDAIGKWDLVAFAKWFVSNPDVPERREEVAEFMDLVYSLWQGSWEDDAETWNSTEGAYNPDKIHKIKFKGKFHKTNAYGASQPSPQRTPVLFQAGQSPSGKAFAGKHAEAVFCGGAVPSDTAPYVKSIREIAVSNGRDPQDVKGLSSNHADSGQDARGGTSEVQLLQISCRLQRRNGQAE
ncbi:hypothetical protein BKA64DRAFT_577995 [Cadophora sp. MPI-SDFR-AT-0126]|nr:hypothetical protein BKA64DRAFT_577995 [Leotiomycetes sp. MPI-SDFR-AT-0126]